MKLFFNIDHKRFQRSIVDQREVTQLETKRGDTERIEVVPVRNQKLAAFDGSITEMVFVVKESYNVNSKPLLWAIDFVLDAASGEWRAMLLPDLPALEALLGDEDHLELKSEFTYTSTEEGTKTSPCANFLVSNDLWKGWEGAPPPPEPTSEDWLTSRAVRHDSPQDLTEAEQDQARENIDAAAIDDPRFEGPRVPLDHAQSHAVGGSDEITPDMLGMGEWLGNRAVRHDELQSLPDSAKLTARTNIDATATNDPRLADARPPLSHAATHAPGGSDPIAFPPMVPLPHAASHGSNGSDPITPQAIGAAKAGDPPSKHAASHAPNGSDPIAQLPPLPHAASHAPGGSDPMPVMPALPHASTHATGGSDPITPGAIGAPKIGDPPSKHAASHAPGGSDPLAPQPPQAHAASHANNGSDPITPQAIGAARAGDPPARHADSHAPNGSDPITFPAMIPLPHAISHGKGGSDPITPAMIGASKPGDPPTVHAGSHAKGGSDEITPQSIGAAAANAMPIIHARTHESDGSDPITPMSIGAADRNAPPLPHAATHYPGGSDPLYGIPMVPTPHASTHATGDSDPITPAMIGAIAKGEFPTPHAITHEMYGDDPIDIHAIGGMKPTDPPAAHAASHANGGSDPITPDSIGTDVWLDTRSVRHDKLQSLQPTPKARARQNIDAVAITDSRLTDARTPKPHAGTHGTNGTDPITPASIGAAKIGDPPGKHAASHETGGNDPITPASIGAPNIGDPPSKHASTHAPNGSDPLPGMPPLLHASTHAAGGSDPITPDSIGAASATAPPIHHASTHGTNGSDPITPDAIGTDVWLDGRAVRFDKTQTLTIGQQSIARTNIYTISAGDPRLTNARTPTIHAPTHNIGGSDPIKPENIGAMKIGDPPSNHASTHAPGGSDPIVIPQQPPLAHATTHVIGGSDEITPHSIGAASLEDPPIAHAHTHEPGGSDPINFPSGGGGPHAPTHAVGGSDPVTPASIGALTQTQADARYISLTENQAISGEKVFLKRLQVNDYDLQDDQTVLTLGNSSPYLVNTYDNQYVEGAKTFNGQMELIGQNPFNATSAMTRGLCDARYITTTTGDARYVTLTGDQSIGGKKTFNQIDGPNQQILSPNSFLTYALAYQNFLPIADGASAFGNYDWYGTMTAYGLDTNNPDSLISVGIADQKYDRMLNVKTWGALGNGTNNDSFAIQSAINAAASDNYTRIVYFPPGIYKCNVTVPPMVRLLGANAPTSSDTSGIGQPTNRVSILIPNDDAKPVVLLQEVSGQEISFLDIVGKGAGTSTTGIRAASASSGNSEGVLMTRVRVSYFTDGISFLRANQCLFNHVAAHYCGRGFYFEQWVAATKLTTCSACYCTTAAMNATYPIALEIDGGVWGFCACPVLNALGSGGNMRWVNSDITACNNPCILITENVSIDISNNRFFVNGGNASAALVRQTDYKANIIFGVNIVSSFNTFAETGAPLAWETSNLQSGYPNVSPLMNVAMRYATDGTFGVTHHVDLSGRRNFDADQEIMLVDEFIGGTETTGQIGDTGFAFTATGTGAVLRSANNPNGQTGILRLTTGTAIGDSIRLHHMLNGSYLINPSYGGYLPWEMIFRFQISALGNEIVHVGFSQNVITNGLPDIFVGARYNPATSPNWFAAVRNTNDVSSVNMNVAVNTNMTTVRLRSFAAGVIRVMIDNNPEFVIASGIPNVNMSPCIWFYSSTATAKIMYVDYFRHRMHNSSRFLEL